MELSSNYNYTALVLMNKTLLRCTVFQEDTWSDGEIK